MPDDRSTPSVSVIIATYNSRGSLGFTLQSVLNQDFHNFEVWIIGDGCTDGSAEVVAAFHDPRLNWINLPHNTGSQSEPNNEGLRRARGRYIAFIGHDDLWFPWHLSTLVKCLEATQADLVHSLCVLIAPTGTFAAIGPPDAGLNYAIHFIPPSTWLHRRSLINEVGFWHNPNSLSHPIDFDFTQRVYSTQKRIEFVPTLSVLKFPSAKWKSYARNDTPQAKYLEALIEDPLALRDQILFDVALAYSHISRQIDRSTIIESLWQIGHAVYSLFRSIGRTVFKRYGRGRWPVANLLHYRYQRSRQKARSLRGLPPLKK